MTRAVQKVDLAVVGAGLAGATAARRAQDAGLGVVVFDKGRGPGGRMSTRRAGPWDHGAQYFTARGARFAATVEAWRAADVVAEWPLRLGARDAAHGLHKKPTDEPRYVGTPGMSGVVAHAVEGLDVRFGVRILRIERVSDGFRLYDLQGPVAEAGRCLLALPAPQAADLLEVAPDLATRCRAVEMAPCWAALLAFEAEVDSPLDGVFVNDGPASWIARDSSKPGRPPGERWVVHARAEWTRAHLEDPPKRIAAALTDELARALEVRLPAKAAADAHRWGYALCPAPLEVGALWDPRAPGLVVAGDWAAGSRVEGAFDSGHAAADHLLSEDA